MSVGDRVAMREVDPCVEKLNIVAKVWVVHNGEWKEPSDDEQQQEANYCFHSHSRSRVRLGHLRGMIATCIKVD